MKKLIFSFVVATFMLTACKDTSSTSQTSQATTDTEEVAEAAPVSNEVEITIEGDDAMKFNLSEIRVKEGQEVTLILDHVGKLAKEAMGHNWVLLKQGVSLSDFAAEAIKAKDNDYIPEDRMDDIIAHTETIGGGEETEIVFTAPAKGTYEFLCSFPGHSAMMQGKFIVE